nr:MAG TPA: hypothetical protein [Caudoviricetes sp.]
MAYSRISSSLAYGTRGRTFSRKPSLSKCPFL